MEKRMFLSHSIAILVLAGLGASVSAATPASLPAYAANSEQTSVSGLSSGAFMAVQMQVAYSSSIVGAGIVAGGPYYCAANNVLYAGICMGQVPFVPPNPSLMARATRNFAATQQIDPLHVVFPNHFGNSS
jgi:poly(3-hydroxybutyrate) depolymerase